MTKRYILLTILMTIAMSLFAAKKRNVVQVEQAPQQVVDDNKRTIKRKVAIGRFSNETQYGKGIFYDKANDPMGKQALDILSSKLAASEKFILLERNDLDALLKEMSAEKGEETKSNTISADYLIIGSITQYGRKNVGENGVFTNKKTQIVEATVSIRLVDVSTGLIIYSDEGKGSAEMVAKSTMGVGGYAGFDATLSDKAISAAISQLVDNIIAKCTDKPWRSYILSYESDDAMIIGGGASQGLIIGDTFAVKEKGKKIKNPQTGVMIELPGKKVADIEVIATGGETPESEYCVVSLKNGSINKENLSNYYIEETK